METKLCPFCGETIMATAKKCRYCGEWLDETAAVPVAQPEVVEYAQPANANAMAVPVVGENTQLPMEAINAAVGQSLASQQNPPMAQPAGQQAMGLNNVMPQITVNVMQQVQQENVQTQENTQIQEVYVEEGEATGLATGSGWILTQLLAIGGLVWAVSHHWWAGLITLIVLAICLAIPFLGETMCVILAIGMAALVGVVSAALGAPTWAAWVIAIFAGLVAGYYNFESRKTFIEED